MYNHSVASCGWGPWGVVDTTGASDYYDTLYLSDLFRVLAYNETRKPVLWTNGGDGTATPSTPAATPAERVSFYCPPSGVPPRPKQIETRLDVWPPTAENLTFPM